MGRRFSLSACLVVAAFLLLSGCVSSGKHEALQKEFTDYKTQATQSQQAAQAISDKLAKDLQGCKGQVEDCLGENENLANTLRAQGKDVQKLTGEKGKLAKEREALTREVEDLRRLRQAAEKRSEEYRNLIAKLKKMIDAGTLSVRIRNGLMIVQMSTDILFQVGKTDIKDEGKKALAELAATLRELKDRRFQVVGHTDDVGIHTQRFPSNWELSTQRAIEVVKLMVKEGVDPKNVSGAGSAEFDPLVLNDSKENKAQNRRVEVVFVPRIDELPGFDQVLKGDEKAQPKKSTEGL